MICWAAALKRDTSAATEAAQLMSLGKICVLKALHGVVRQLLTMYLDASRGPQELPTPRESAIQEPSALGLRGGSWLPGQAS